MLSHDLSDAIASRDITSEIPISVATTYIDLQFGNTLTLLKRDEPDEVIKAFMQLAFSVFS